MHIQNTSEIFLNEFYLSIDLIDKIGDLRIRQFIDRLDKVSDEIIVESIIKIFENINRPSTEYDDQKYAGKILTKLNPKTNVDLSLVLQRTIGNWNKSIEEFPFWLKENYGIELLKNILNGYDNLNAIEAEKLKTMKWWLKI